MHAWLYYLLATLLAIVNIASVAGNLVAIPGNWIIVVTTGLFAWLVHTPSADGVHWWVVVALLVFAILGEATEMASGSVTAARVGAGKRGMAGALIGSLVGSVLGAIIGVPVPIIGSAIAAMLGGGLGALAGAVIGEKSTGRASRESLTVGVAALIGKLVGTVGKIVIGIVMLVVATFDSFL